MREYDNVIYEVEKTGTNLAMRCWVVVRQFDNLHDAQIYVSACPDRYRIIKVIRLCVEAGSAKAKNA